jgi:hypothetical protein
MIATITSDALIAFLQFQSRQTLAPLVLFSQTIFAIVRGFAKPLLGILRTSLGVAPADARSVES